MFNQLKKVFGKRTKDFIEMLIDQAKKSQECMTVLYEFMQNPSKETGEKIYRIEEEADELRRILIAELNRSFVTPFDREDIFALSRSIDDMVDYAKSTVEEMLLFEISTNEFMKKISEALLNAAKEIVLAITTLKPHPSVCSEHLIRTKKAENFVEHRYREALVELFKEDDTKKILKTREIYRHLSNAADRADESANIIGNILVKTT